MNKGGAPANNQNAAKGKIFYDALRKLAIQEPHRVRAIVETLVEAAEAGEAWAIREVIDRLDGKATQVQELTGLDGAPLLTNLTVNFVKPKDE